MLIVKTRIARSAIHGYGLFAAERIGRGTPIWRFTSGFDLDLDPACLDTLPALARDYLLHYGYIDPRLNCLILCCDDARFMNHCDRPNTFTDYSLDDHGVDLAARDIDMDKEIALNYAIVEGGCP